MNSCTHSNTVTGWWWMVYFMRLLLYPRGNNSWYTLNRRLGEPQSWSGCFGEEINLLPLPGTKPHFPTSPADSLSHQLHYPSSNSWIKTCVKTANIAVTAKQTNKLPDKLLYRFNDTAQVHRLTRTLHRLTEIHKGKNSLSTLKTEAEFSSIISVSIYLSAYIESKPEDVTWTCIDNLTAKYKTHKYSVGRA